MCCWLFLTELLSDNTLLMECCFSLASSGVGVIYVVSHTLVAQMGAGGVLVGYFSLTHQLLHIFL